MRHRRDGAALNPPFTPIVPAELALRADGTLYSPRFADVYASSHGALEQARHVFLAGNGLPERWRREKDFTLVETGFGAGLNFLATWQAFRTSAPADARLHYVSVEKHPFRREDLAKIYARHPELAGFTQPLFLQWPALLPGFHRLHFEGGRLGLTLLFGDAAQLLSQLDACADAFYLDGFAPARNEAMWSDAVFRETARLAAPGATCATYTVAAKVRAGLAAAGFSVEKRRGFAAKQEMLAGAFQGAGRGRADAPARRAIVIGAGLAGTSCAQALVRRGWSVRTFERHAGPAQEASGNPAGLIRPVISADWNTHSRFTTAGFLYATRHLEALQSAGHGIVRGQGGVLQLARDAARFRKLQDIVEDFALPGDFVRSVDQAQASERAGASAGAPGWWFPGAMWASPASMCASAIAAAGAGLEPRYGTEVAAIARAGHGWEVRDASGAALASAPTLVLANAAQARLLEPTSRLPLRTVRGQISFVPARTSGVPRIAVSGDGYVTPPIDGRLCVGASFNEGMEETGERVEDHEGNLARLQRMLPGLAAGLEAGGLRGRVAFRTMAKDRLPVVGPVGPAGLFACLALGSRGMTWSALAAELLASQVCGEPLPLEQDLVAGLDPRRFG
jgi:tRNA 5-methylaminomethyl-2-thiouridine biosynthesis bifunctional protein